MTRFAFAVAAAVLAFGLPAAAQTLKIGTEASYKPFAYVLPSGDMTGFDIDITNALCKQMGAECQIVNQAFDGLIPALMTKRIDAIIASMYITPERQQAIDFAGPYYSVPALFIAAKGSGISPTAEGLAGKYVGVQRGTTMADYITASFPDARVQLYDTIDAATLDLGSGRVDAVFADSVPLEDFLAANADYERIGEPIYDAEILGTGAGIGLRKEDGELKAKFDAALAAIIASGEYQAINEKYINVSILPK